MSSISGITSNYLQSLLATSQSGQSTNVNSSNTSDALSASSFNSKSDGARLSPVARLLSSLQQIQQSNPAEYKSLMSQISTNLKKAADDASSQGNSDAAKVLNQLSTDFSKASQSGDLPNIEDMAQAMSGTGTGDGSTTDASQRQLQDAAAKILNAFHSHGTKDKSTDPMAIIFDTLSSAGAIQRS